MEKIEKSKVSIIVPIYNSSAYLKRCIESIINQTYKDIEIILVNDGSTDNSEKICLMYAQQDSRIRYYLKENSGVSASRNYGLEKANMDYVIFLDSDDYLSLTMVEKMVDVVNSQKLDLVICNFSYDNNSIITQRKRKIKSFCGTKEEFIKKFDLFYESRLFNQPWNKMFKKDLIKEKFKENLSLGEDLLFNISYLNNTSKIGYLNENLYFYNSSNENSLTKKLKHTLDEYLEININIYKELYLKNEIKVPLNMDKRFLMNYIKLQNDYIKSCKIYNFKENYTKVKKIIVDNGFNSIREKIVFSKLNYYILSTLYLLVK